MTLLLLLRPSKSSDGGTVVIPPDTHDGGDDHGWKKHYHFEILTESQWKKLYQPGSSELKQPEPVEPEPIELIEQPSTDRSSIVGLELDDARARYLYAAYKASTLRENLDKLRSQIAIQEMLSFEKAQKAINERALSIAIADLEKKYLQEERARVQAMKLLEELDSEDFMINLLLH